MIAKGNLHGDGGKLAQYLINGDGNEIAEMVEARGLEYLGRDPIEAFEMLQKVAEANTQSTKPFFHVQTRNPFGDKQLTNEEWLQIADREGKRLGFDGQPRIVSFHIFPNGEKHLHVGWCRIDLETMRAIDPGLFKNHLKQLCRTLEKEYGLQEVSNVRKPEDIARIADRKEVEEARRLGMDDRAIRNTIVDCLQRTDGGKAFNAALDERGLILANGDKRDCFVVIDQAGGHHALNKKLTDLTLGALRDRLRDLDRSQLPSVDRAKAMQQEKYPTPEQAREDWDRRAGVAQPETARSAQPEPTPPRSKAGADIHATWSQSPTPEAFVSAMHDQGYRMARVSPEEARDSERIAAFAKELGNRAPRYREGEIVAVNDRGWTYRLNENSTGAERTDILKFTAELKDRALPSMGEARALQLAEANKHRQTEPWHQRDASKTEMKISGIQEAADRGGVSVAAGLQAEGLTLARVDMAGRASGACP
jgi:Relaxase/Mobilisation nuclease domain